MATVPQLATPSPAATVPLVVDVDRALIRSDLLLESVFSHLGTKPLRALRVLWARLRGAAATRTRMAGLADIDAASLPYDEAVLALIQEARDAKRPVYFASANHEPLARKVAEHLGVGDGLFASSDSEYLSTSERARRLETTFGAGGFDYVGRDRADLSVWRLARRRIAVRASPSARSKLTRIDPDALVLSASENRLRSWIKLLRLHQWSKNVLVFLPLVTGHWFGLGSVTRACAAFVAFSIAASAIYILNDLVDLQADRRHRTKRLRPLAAGTVPIASAAVVAPLLLAGALTGGFLINEIFGAVLAIYAMLTTAYTFVLKRKVMVDIITLAGLYTIRVIGGAAAIAAVPSEWILAFSMFIFTALALIKRYVELAARVDANLPEPTHRNYRKADLSAVAALAAASGFNAVTVFAMYVASDTARQLYRHPKLLWLVCPILMYWLGRTLLLAHRRLVDDDPIVFALKDRNSLLSFALIGAIMLGAF